jgi:hypothetical protein
MNGEANLLKLLHGMRPELQDGVLFCSLELAVASELGLSPIGLFLEEEGLTLTLAKDEAEANHLNFTFPCRKITLKKHSSLKAVGFLAFITEKLAQQCIRVDAISAYVHDHLFGSSEEAEDAMRVMSEVVERSLRKK